MKKLLLILVISIIIAVATIPLWGTCDLKYRFCTTLCDLRHGNSELQKTTCRTRCTTEKAACLAGEGVEKFGRMLEGDGRSQ